MKLKKFLSKKRGLQAELARTIGAHPSDVSAWASGKRSIPIHFCRAIVDFSFGEVTLQDLREDWKKYWTELEAKVLQDQADEKTTEKGERL